MVAPRQALELILAGARPLPPAATPLAEALGRCLAEDVRADRDIPPADRSAMDGYAVRAADLAAGRARLRLVGEVAAGSPARPRVRAGTCVRILTGANVPPGADTVVMVEQTAEAGGEVIFRHAPERGANIRRRGEDAPRGAVLVPRGAELNAMHAGACAAVGKASVRVHRQPRVALVATGAELRPAGAKVGAHQVRNSNGPALAAALRAWGFAGATELSSPDNLRTLIARLRRALRAGQVVLVTGGVSAGRYDFVRPALEALGARIRFHGVAMKPGRPLLYATAGGGRHVFGLPGNPLSAMVAFHEFALPALRRLAGFAPGRCRPSLWLPLAGALAAKGGPMRFLPAQVSWTPRGPGVEPVRSLGSADLVSAGRADGVIAVPAGTRALAAGELVEFRPWRPLP